MIGAFILKWESQGLIISVTQNLSSGLNDSIKLR